MVPFGSSGSGGRRHGRGVHDPVLRSVVFGLALAFEGVDFTVEIEDTFGFLEGVCGGVCGFGGGGVRRGAGGGGVGRLGEVAFDDLV